MGWNAIHDIKANAVSNCESPYVGVTRTESKIEEGTVDAC
jgi:hypothetical protein